MDHPTAWKKIRLNFYPKDPLKTPEWHTERSSLTSQPKGSQLAMVPTTGQCTRGWCLMREKPLTTVQNLPEIKYSFIWYMASETNLHFNTRHTPYWVIDKRPNCPQTVRHHSAPHDPDALLRLIVHQEPNRNNGLTHCTGKRLNTSGKIF